MNQPMRLSHVHAIYGQKPVLKDFSLELKPGAVTCLLGPSGSGKTTVLHLLAGLLQPTAGVVERPQAVSCLFQDLRLLPWRTASGNLVFVLKGHVALEALEPSVEQALKLVELWEERHCRPHQLSGGMKQRLALARALAVPADLLLLDEPFRGLDIPLRERIMARCRERWQEAGQTVLLVTHDPAEAAYLGDEVLQFRPEGPL